MKSTLLLLAFFITATAFAQDRIAKITSEYWNESENKWTFNYEDTWDYNTRGQEILYTHQDSYAGDFWQYDYMEVKTLYNEYGNQLQQKVLNSGIGWHQQLITNQYNDQQILTESLTKNTQSELFAPQYYRRVYEQNEAENKRSVYFYSANNNPDNWQLTHKTDSTFNDHGCIIKKEYISYESNGNETSKNWWTYTYTPDCQLLTSEYWIKDIQENVDIPLNKSSYEYFNDGKTVRRSYYRFNANQWELKNVFETEVDDAERIIRYLYVTHTQNYIDTLLRLTTYTPKGERATYKQYRTGNSGNDYPLVLIQVDSFVYHYNEEDWLAKKEAFIKTPDYPWNVSTTYYSYYCLGQLKQSILSWGSSHTRTSYEYHSETGCPLDENESPKILVFPNPSHGSFTINSNLISTPNARLSITSVLGRTVYTEQLNRLTKEYSLEFPNLPNGRYVVTLSNDEDIRSEVIVINN